MKNFKKLSQKQQFQATIAFIKSYPKDEQDFISEECLGMTLSEATRIMKEL